MLKIPFIFDMCFFIVLDLKVNENRLSGDNLFLVSPFGIKKFLYKVKILPQ